LVVLPEILIVREVLVHVGIPALHFHDHVVTLPVSVQNPAAGDIGKATAIIQVLVNHYTCVSVDNLAAVDVLLREHINLFCYDLLVVVMSPGRKDIYFYNGIMDFIY